MKTIISSIIMFILLFFAVHSNAQIKLLITPQKKTNVQIPEKIKSFIVKKLGLSSTGSMQIIGSYRLTQDCKLGKDKDKIVHLIQKDLFGARLFWSCLINVTSGKVQVLYRCQKPDDFGTIINITK